MKKIRLKGLLSILLAFLIIFNGSQGVIANAKNSSLVEIDFYNNVTFSVDNEMYANSKTVYNCRILGEQDVINQTYRDLMCFNSVKGYVYEFRILDLDYSMIGIKDAETFSRLLCTNLSFDTSYTQEVSNSGFFLANSCTYSEFEYVFNEDCYEITAKVDFKNKLNQNSSGYVKYIEDFNGYGYVYLMGYNDNSESLTNKAKEMVFSLDYDNNIKGTMFENCQDKMVEQTFSLFDYNYTFSMPSFLNRYGNEQDAFETRGGRNFSSGFKYYMSNNTYNLVGGERAIYFNKFLLCFVSYEEIGTITDKSGNVWDKYKFSNGDYYYIMNDNTHNKLACFYANESEFYNTEELLNMIVSSFSLDPSTTIAVDGYYDLGDFFVTSSLFDFYNGVTFRKTFLFETPLYSSYFSREENATLKDKVYEDIYVEQIYALNKEVVATEETVSTETPTTEVIPETTETITEVVIEMPTETTEVTESGGETEESVAK